MSMTPEELIQLANQLLIVAGRIPGVITVTGPPANTLGAVGSSAFWAEERTWYGPKTAEGWPPGVVVTEGPQGLSAKQIVINAGLLPPGATDAQFATWLADAQIAKVQPLVDAAATSATSAASDAGAAQTAATAAGEARDEAEAAKSAVAGAADATAADRLATGADRTAVADDRAAVEAAALAASGHANDAASAAGASVAAKELAEGAASAAAVSAAATADDALATAADRQAVADDKAAVAADRAAAEAAAQTATSEAGAASGHADNADTARIAAEAAQAAAEQARDEAEAIAGGDFVTGPTSSTDGRLAVFAGTSGKAVKEGPAFGVGAPGDVLRRSDGDGRYRAAGDVPLAEVTGLGAALTDIDGALIAQAQAIAGKQDALGFTPADAADTYTKGEVDAALEVKADLVDGKVPLEQLPPTSGGGLEVGDILTTARNPGSKYLPADGSSYLRTAWPELSPLLPDGGSLPFTGFMAKTLPSSVYWRAVAWGNGRFVAVARNTTAAAVSLDGENWVSVTLPASLNWSAITFGSGLFLATASDTASYATSADGENWTLRSFPASGYWTRLAAGGGRLVAIDGGNSRNRVLSSGDGANWTQSTLPATTEWVGVAYGNGVFLAVGATGTTAASSADGVNWTSRTRTSLTAQTIVFGDGQFLVTSNTTAAASTPDGAGWTPRTLPSSGGWASAAHGAGLFVVAAYGTTSYVTSPDLMNWTSRTLASAGNWSSSSFVFGGNRFVLMSAGDGTSIQVSNSLTDPTTFAVPSIPGDDPIKYYIKGEA